MNDILIWCTANGLSCNSDKTEIVHLSSRFNKNVPIAGVNMNGLNIAPTPSARNLGVTVDSNLRMTEHVNNLCKAAMCSVRNIGRIRK